MNKLPVKILIVDDEEDVRDLLKDMLELEGYITCTAVDGKEGLQHYNKFRPDLVITDIKMPVMDGIEFVKNLQTISQEVKVVFITGFDRYENKVKNELMKDSHYKFVKKPFNIIDILSVVSNYIKE